MTAYDMRFSAWSSDVCASNLAEPAGGNASAIARALGWLVQRGAAVTTISLVGPDNKLLATAVSRAQQRGMLIVAAVGNDGPAAPPAYRSEEHTSELQSLMRLSYAVFCLTKNNL